MLHLAEEPIEEEGNKYTSPPMELKEATEMASGLARALKGRAVPKIPAPTWILKIFNPLTPNKPLTGVVRVISSKGKYHVEVVG